MKIVKLRSERGLTQADLATSCGTTQQQIAKIEKGLVDPKLTTLRRISNSLGCELSDLFWSKNEFLSELNKVIKSHGMNLKKINFLKLNDLCRKECFISPFHPYWEEIQIKNNKLCFKEEENEKK